MLFSAKHNEEFHKMCAKWVYVRNCKMVMILRSLLVSLLMIGMSACGNSQVVQTTEILEPVVAFPGAEGFGKYTTGGRGGKVYVVNNLNDNGPGSFREAATAKGKRIIVFAISGTIHLETQLSIRGDVTIAGQSAPGDGICIADQSVVLGGDNVIIRYMRFRMGDKYQRQAGKIDGSGSDDAFTGGRRKNVIIDHCSFSWSTDEVLSIYGGDSVTLQWNLIAEPLNYSYHFENGDKDFEQHGYGGIWGGSHLSAHHNLFAHCVSRTPRFNGTRLGASLELVDYRNNVIYNWGGNNVYGGEGGSYNVVGNYYKPGPATSKKVLSRIVNPTRNEQVGFGKFYVQGNVVEGFNAVSEDNNKGIDIGDGKTAFSFDSIVMQHPFAAMPLTLQTADDAFKAVLASVGASFRRDTLDARVLWNVAKGNGNFIDVQGGYPHGTPFEQTLNAWPVLKSLPAPPDSDNDGMPDNWEKKYGLNPNDAKDANAHTLHKSYSNIEVYVNSLL
jgi:pectate lyase